MHAEQQVERDTLSLVSVVCSREGKETERTKGEEVRKGELQPVLITIRRE